ncbi:MAG: pyridoxal-phosphate dependent enzyme [Actinomycetota bacterium]|nr:pyridoxal-phosphate dependent enzyme [Actinomycetota bacterium]
MGDTRRTGWGGEPVSAPSLDEIRSASERLRGTVVRTPLVGLHSYDTVTDIHLKPEVLQPVGSFKIRGVGNWALSLSDAERRRGISTTSAGNTAAALGYMARRLGVPARSMVPFTLHETKRRMLGSYGVELVEVAMEDLMAYMFEEKWRDEPYSYLNPWGEPLMIAGHATIGVEIFEDLPEIESVFIPVGGGALLCGVAAALKTLKPSIRVYAVQAEVNSALSAAFKNGGPLWIEWHDTVVEGASTPVITDEMYPLLRSLVDEVVLVSEDQVKDAMRRLALRNKLVTEGAGAAAVAAALSVPVKQRGTTVCVVSGGSVDEALLREILDRPG